MDAFGNTPDAEMKRRALEQLMAGQDQTPQEPTLWDRIKALFSAEGPEWADNANAMLPGEVSARGAVLRKRQQDEMMDEMNEDD